MTSGLFDMDIILSNYNRCSVHERALICAKLCWVAYNNDNVTKQKLGISNEIHDKIAHLKCKTIQYFIYETDDCQFLVIRGTDTKMGITETISDLLVSLNFFPKRSDSGVYCHGGYSDVGNKIIEQIIKKHVLKRDKKLIVTGHSLGGAVAKYISIHVNKEIEIYTFGSPQISDKHYFVFKHTTHEFHYMNPHDWICSFPSSMYNDDKFLYVIVDGCVRRRRIRSLGIVVPFVYLSLRSIFAKCGILKHHELNTYIKNLESCSPK